MNQHGEAREITAGDALGRCLQHETDHPRGQVFGDRLHRCARQQPHRDHESVAALHPKG